MDQTQQTKKNPPAHEVLLDLLTSEVKRLETAPTTPVVAAYHSGRIEAFCEAIAKSDIPPKHLSEVITAVEQMSGDVAQRYPEGQKRAFLFRAVIDDLIVTLRRRREEAGDKSMRTGPPEGSKGVPH